MKEGWKKPSTSWHDLYDDNDELSMSFMEKIKKFLAEYELLTIPLFFVLCAFSFEIITKLFNPDASVRSPPNYETYYFAFRTLLIAAAFLLVKWLWFKRDSPQSAETMKKGWVTKDERFHNYELIYANAKWFLYLFWLALIALAVFP